MSFEVYAMNPSAIIIGASSGIGEALALELNSHGYSLGLASRRTELLQELASKLKHRAHIRELDLANPSAPIPREESSHLRYGDMSWVCRYCHGTRNFFILGCVGANGSKADCASSEGSSWPRVRDQEMETNSVAFTSYSLCIVPEGMNTVGIGNMTSMG
jgi:hypothetical protein